MVFHPEKISGKYFEIATTVFPRLFPIAIHINLPYEAEFVKKNVHEEFSLHSLLVASFMLVSCLT
jgi:hypothetical protein